MALAVIQKQRVKPLMRLQKIAENDQLAVVNSVDNYGNLIWAMARNLTHLSEDAENVVREIFLDIWQNAARFDSTDFDELIFMTITARRRLIELSTKT